MTILEAEKAVLAAMVPAAAAKRLAFTVSTKPRISNTTFFTGCGKALTAEAYLIASGSQKLSASSRTLVQSVSVLRPGGAARSVKEVAGLTRCSKYRLGTVTHDQLQRQDVSAVKGFDGVSSWCERLNRRSYSCVSVASKGDLLLQMSSVSGTLKDAQRILRQFLDLSAAQLAG